MLLRLPSAAGAAAADGVGLSFRACLERNL